jgi:hypothetical protein
LEPYLPGSLSIAWHAFSHRLHSSAQAFMWLSVEIFSHSAAHLAQASIQASQMILANGPPRASICEAAAQIVAQSWHVASVTACSFFPT